MTKIDELERLIQEGEKDMWSREAAIEKYMRALCYINLEILKKLKE